MRSKRLRAAAVGALLALTATLAGCGGTTAGSGADDISARQSMATANDWPVAGATKATTGPKGPRAGVPDAPLHADNGNGGEMDRLALDTIADLKDYWSTEYAKNFPGTFAPVSKFISWDSTAPQDQAVTFCRSSTYQMVNAAYCKVDDTIGWDRGTLLPLVANKYGKMAVVMVLAHEYGHSIQHMAKMNGFLTPGIVLEQQADCFAGVFLHHVAENGSAHFTLNTTDGLNGVLGATVAVRDRDPNDSDNVHGSAFERVTAVQIGWTDGIAGCKTINKKEIQQRRGGLPITFRDDDAQHQEVVDEDGLKRVAAVVAALYPSGPNAAYTGIPNCPVNTSTEPVSYCPATDTVGVDVPELAKRAGRQQGDHDPLSAIVDGNYNAFLPFISRYMLGIEQHRKQSLTGAATAGLRTACLAGVVTTKLSAPGDEQLDAGDLDAAVSGLLADGIAAGDVDGKVVPTGYDRLEAFRTGVLDGESACQSRYA